MDNGAISAGEDEGRLDSWAGSEVGEKSGDVLWDLWGLVDNSVSIFLLYLAFARPMVVEKRTVVEFAIC